MSSSDGFCSTLSFAPGELGQVYTGPTSTGSNQVSSNAPSTNITPLPTPTHVPSPIKAAHAPASSGGLATANGQVPPASPARSNSAGSVATQSSTQQSAAVINNPTPTLGSVPSVTATHSAQPSTLPLTTPPQTPLPNTVIPSIGSVLGKRDAPATSESEKEDSKGSESTAATQQPKKRRIAPTLISAGTDSASSKAESQNPNVGS
jgi:chromatin assembly factor 1 subunit B